MAKIKIDWQSLETGADWAGMAKKLIEQARDSVKAKDEQAMQDASDLLLEFIQEKTMACPRAVSATVFAAQDELVRDIAQDVVTNIASRTAQYNAFLDDIKNVTAELQRKANLISLKPVIKAVDAGKALVDDLKKLSKDFKGDPADLDLQSINTSLAKIIGDFQGVFESIEEIKPENEG